MKRFVIILLLTCTILFYGKQIPSIAHTGHIENNSGYYSYITAWDYPNSSYHTHHKTNAGNSKASTPANKKYSSDNARRNRGREVLKKYQQNIISSADKSKVVSYRKLPTGSAVANIISLPAGKSDLTSGIQLISKDESPWEDKRENAGMEIR